MITSLQIAENNLQQAFEIVGSTEDAEAQISLETRQMLDTHPSIKFECLSMKTAVTRSVSERLVLVCNWVSAISKVEPKGFMEMSLMTALLFSL